MVTGQGDFAAHTAFAETIADDIWARRHQVLNDYLSVEDAAAIAATYQSSHGPLIIADYADNPGAGGYGDSTDLLRALLDARAENACFGPMVDGEGRDLLRRQQLTGIVTRESATFAWIRRVHRRNAAGKTRLDGGLLKRCHFGL